MGFMNRLISGGTKIFSRFNTLKNKIEVKQGIDVGKSIKSVGDSYKSADSEGRQAIRKDLINKANNRANEIIDSRFPGNSRTFDMMSNIKNYVVNKYTSNSIGTQPRLSRVCVLKPLAL
eukprot:Awhi_evm11s12155